MNPAESPAESPAKSTAERFATEVRERLVLARERAAAFEARGAAEAENWIEVALELDAIFHPLDAVAGRVTLYSAVHPESRVRDVSEELERELEAFSDEFELSRAAHDRLASIEDAARTRASEDPEAAHFVQKRLRELRRGGVDRDDDVRARIRELRRELLAIGQRFERNIVEDTRWIEIEAGDAGRALAGMPEDWVRAHPPGENGKIRITTDPQDFLPFASFAEDAASRHALYRARHSRGMPANIALLRELLTKREELAKLLGFATWAEVDFDDKMARTPRAVREFVERCDKVARARARVELDEMREEKRRSGASEEDARVVRDSERFFLAEKVRARRFGLDARELGPYFEVERTVKGLLDLSARIWRVTFQPIEDADSWHADVRSYDVSRDGVTIARFHLDLYPREGKYKHAALFPLDHGLPGRTVPEAAIVCNFSAPTGGEDAFLLHEQVTTLFHEFGHLLHHLFGGGQRILALSGIATELDFVETPSQLAEEWAWDPDVLARFAVRADGTVISGELVRRMRAADEWGKGFTVGVQLYYTMLSLELHERPARDLDIEALVAELQGRWSPFPFEPGTCFAASFGHLTGYGAAYYSYLWALVIAKDLWRPFEERGPLDAKAADHYRREVLERGGKPPAGQLVGSRLGRPYETGAFEAWLAR